MSPAPEAGVEVVVVEPLSGVSVAAGRTAGLRRRRARVARQRVGREAGGLDGARGPPGGEVVVVLHWFLWLTRSPVGSFSLAGRGGRMKNVVVVSCGVAPYTDAFYKAGGACFLWGSAVLLCISVCATLGSFSLFFWSLLITHMEVGPSSLVCVVRAPLQHRNSIELVYKFHRF